MNSLSHWKIISLKPIITDSSFFSFLWENASMSTPHPESSLRLSFLIPLLYLILYKTIMTLECIFSWTYICSFVSSLMYFWEQNSLPSLFIHFKLYSDFVRISVLDILLHCWHKLWGLLILIRLFWRKKKRERKTYLISMHHFLILQILDSLWIVSRAFQICIIHTIITVILGPEIRLVQIRSWKPFSCTVRTDL